MKRDPHTLPNPTKAQQSEAKRRVSAALAEIENIRVKAGALVSPYHVERHPAIAQIIAYQIAPIIAAGLVERAAVDARLNRVLGRRGAATPENAVLSRSLTRLGRRARGAA